MPAYNQKQVEAGLRRYDVGVDANGFKPVSIESIVLF
jgi:calcineurin-like phosphoesterase family protein